MKSNDREKFKRSHARSEVYNQLKHMIVSGKLKKEKKVFREHIAHNLKVNKATIDRAFAKLKEDGLVIVRGSSGSFVKGN